MGPDRQLTSSSFSFAVPDESFDKGKSATFSLQSVSTSWVTLLLMYGGFLLLFLQQAGAPFTIDEAAFPYAASGILESGAPYFYNGETRPNDLGMWHPPLYVYSLALFQFLFGDSVWATRLFGAVAVIAASFVLRALIREIAPEASRRVQYLGTALFLFNPLVLSGALVPDIDGTVAMVTVAAALWVSVVTVTRGLIPQNAVLIAVIWFFLLYTKFVIAALMLPVLLAAPLVGKDRKWTRAAVSLVAVAVGTIVFMATYFVLARVAGFPASAPFDYFLGNFSKGQNGINNIIVNVAARLSPTSGVPYFLTVGLLVSALLGLVLCLVNRNLLCSRRAVVLLGLSSGYLIIAYAVLAGSPYTFPKYWGIVVVPLSALAALLGQNWPIRWPRRASFSRRIGAGALLSLLGAAAIALVVWFADLTTQQLSGGLRDVEYQTVLILGLTLVAWLALIGISIMSIGTDNQMRIPFFKALPICLVAAATISAVTIDLVHRSAGFSTRYYLSEEGLDSTIRELQLVVKPNATLLAPKDVGLQTNRRFFEDALILPMTETDLRETLERIDVDYVVTRNKWDYSEVVFPESFAVIREVYEPTDRQPSPDFVIWQKRDDD